MMLFVIVACKFYRILQILQPTFFYTVAFVFCFDLNMQKNLILNMQTNSEIDKLKHAYFHLKYLNSKIFQRFKNFKPYSQHDIFIKKLVL